MKKLVMATLFLALFSGSTLALAKHFWRGKTLSSAEVIKRWGNEPFDQKRFRTGGAEARARMANSIVSSKIFLNKTVDELRGELGPWDGYYFSDMFPAYIIQDGRAQKSDTWQIVFLLNNKERVSEVFVHKNCCE